MKGWTSGSLPVLGDDPAYWTVAEAAALLGPPQLTPEQVRQLIRLCSLRPAGRRRSGPQARGRYPAVYTAVKLIEAYDSIYRIGQAGC